MPTLRDESTLQSLLERLDRLTPETTPRWGKFDATSMLAHCNEGMRMGTGELEIEYNFNPAAVQPLKWLILNVFPMPKGVKTAPKLLRDVKADPEVFEEERRQLKERLQTFCDRPEADTYPLHPVFGRMSRKAWDGLAAKHLDHHLKQFGV